MTEGAAAAVSYKSFKRCNNGGFTGFPICADVDLCRTAASFQSGTADSRSSQRS